jgi:hypothetical protein
MEHSPTSATGTGWERTPLHKTQRAACRHEQPLAALSDCERAVADDPGGVAGRVGRRAQIE